MAQRTIRGKNRARNLALPFVVTAAAACTVRTAPASPKTQGASGDSPTVKGEAPTSNGNATAVDSDVKAISNPPPPKPPIATVNPPAPNALPAAPTTGGSVYVTESGECMWTESVTCPPNTMCNPPPPRQVQCPEQNSSEK